MNLSEEAEGAANRDVMDIEEENKSSEPTGSISDEGGRHDDTQSKEFVRKETHYVTILRIVVLVILLLAAGAVCSVMYIITDNNEQAEFTSQFDAASLKVMNHFLDIPRDKMGAAGSLVVAIVAHGIALGHAWPFVTLSSFQQRAATVKRLSGALYIGMNPVVTYENRVAWENYSRYSEDSEWYLEGREYQQDLGFDDLDNRPQVQTDDLELDLSGGIANHIYSFHRDSDARAIISPMKAMYLPVWQTSPVTRRTMVNQDRASNSEAALNCLYDDVVVFEGMQRSNPGYGSDSDPYTAEFAWLLRLSNREKSKYEGDIFTTVYFPLFDNFSANRTTVGVMRIVIQWARYFRKILPDTTKGVVFVLENGCDDPFTYQIDGGEVIPLGSGDLHDPDFDHMERTASFANITSIEDGTNIGLRLHQNQCTFQIRIYPSKTLLSSYKSRTPAIITMAVGFVFIFAVFIFFVYDRLVERRQKLIMAQAQRTHRIVAELFPEKVRDQLLNYDESNPNSKQRFKSMIDDDGQYGNNSMNNAPVIADLFPYATVLFADIAGFTAWSSSREPAQVFILLQNVYKRFDDIAKRRRVFKVETIGDSYVAVTGLPEPQPKHAIIMTKFANECLHAVREVTQDLESLLGPDTGDLTMRFGIHSGPVTAGVLRGERSRFQLFGDTVNTASRMESTGVPDRIQISQSTADLLIANGKEHWIHPRTDNVTAKGKGVMKTFWVDCYEKYSGSPSTAASSDTGDDDAGSVGETPNSNLGDSLFIDKRTGSLLKHQRMIDWVVELLKLQIEKIVAKQATQESVTTKKKSKERHQHSRGSSHGLHLTSTHKRGRIALDEVVDAITFPRNNFKSKPDATDLSDGASVKVTEEIMTLLRRYVAIIADAHRDNPFHNFEHACHVTMCVSKFLNRMAIFEADVEDEGKMKDGKQKIASHLHDYTYDVVTDPITVFATIFAAFIHDVDHPGVSNAQLIIEEPQMAHHFKERSVAEQNSLEVSWSLFMSSQFKPLREYIFTTSEDLLRFRQVLVNCVLATDIFDSELKTQRQARFDRVFAPEALANTSSAAWRKDADTEVETNALRATVALEYIIQASDVSHTMQHWHTYQRWNKSLFRELSAAYLSGRLKVNPASFWYRAELDFFDEYIIPLAKKLKDCSVLGVSSDECLNYALQNRDEWEMKGEEIVAEMASQFCNETSNDAEALGAASNSSTDQARLGLEDCQQGKPKFSFLIEANSDLNELGSLRAFTPPEAARFAKTA